MKFRKYQGLGNDFVLIDGMSGKIAVDPDWCRKMCDRHFGIGADGVLYVLSSDIADFGMRIINADGSEAEMCGNGIRCVAKYIRDTGLCEKDGFTIHTLAGVLVAETLPGADGNVETVKIDMGAPVLDGRTVPVDFDGRFIDMPFEIDGIRLRGNAVSMGNPHFVVFDDLDDVTIETLGPKLEKHPFFPRKTNVEFCSVRDGKIHIRVYERGAAWTLACGTGACASTVAAALNGLVPFGRPVDVHLPGGWLKITVAEDLSHVHMEGPAKLVFEGTTEE